MSSKTTSSSSTRPVRRKPCAIAATREYSALLREHPHCASTISHRRHIITTASPRRASAEKSIYVSLLLLATTIVFFFVKPKWMNQESNRSKFYVGEGETTNENKKIPFPVLVTGGTRLRPKLSSNLTDTQSDRPLPCVLLKDPTPIILMSLGRSGTASMYQVLSKLAGNGKSPQIIEYTGGSTTKSRKFFQNIPVADVHGDWLIQYVCDEQTKHPNAGIVGFKWKPFETIFSEEKALQGLELLGRLKSAKSNAIIKVVRSKRNLLDVIISRYKHQGDNYKRYSVVAHCQKGDKKCVQQHLDASTGMTLKTTKLISQLTELDEMERRTDQLLSKMNVPTIHVSFEKLFLGTDASEWTRTFDFLGTGPKNLSMADVEKAGHAATSVWAHNATLSNYDEIAEVLCGTKFEQLLH